MSHGQIHFLCLDHLYPALHPDSDLGRGRWEAPGLLGAAGSESSTWETSVSLARNNSILQGHPQVIVLCVLPSLPITPWLREEVLGTDLNEFRKSRELIQAKT